MWAATSCSALCPVSLIRAIPVTRGNQLQRNVSVLLGRVLVTLGVEHLQRINQFFAGLARADDCVHVALFRSDIRIGESVTELVRLFFAKRSDDLLFLRV